MPPKHAGLNIVSRLNRRHRPKICGGRGDGLRVNAGVVDDGLAQNLADIWLLVVGDSNQGDVVPGGKSVFDGVPPPGGLKGGLSPKYSERLKMLNPVKFYQNVDRPGGGNYLGVKVELQ